ncbi:hypothetical protein SAMN07250955_103343 [Arboricoccus pini]|uniref:Uncharacterized protein n=1 Tax=Arboricoccus pini TaxID=1963835 RepID=A0A212QUU7_9PROT|nr:hypothetical protein SAMN07250955_103343 [Arboricoccus pini]
MLPCRVPARPIDRKAWEILQRRGEASAANGEGGALAPPSPE